MTTTNAVITDTHAMSDHGLLNPDTIFYALEDGTITEQDVTLTDEQIKLWHLHLEIIEQAEKLSSGKELNLFHLGDISQGAVFSDDLASAKLSDHVQAAYYNFKPWFELPNLTRVRIAVGSGIHEWGSGSVPLIVTRMLQIEFPQVDTKVVYHGLINMGGVRVDFAHHGANQSTRSWLHGNLARFDLRDRIIKSLMAGEDPPDLFLRGHFHTVINEAISEWIGGKFREFRYCVIPPLCGIGNYAIKAIKSPDFSFTGGAIFQVDDGRLQSPFWVINQHDLRGHETWAV